MPFIDFNDTGTVSAANDAEFTIIGAGAAGIFMATKLAALGRRVLLVETGHFLSDEERQSLNVIVQSGKPLSNPVWNRRRVLGGTTTFWGGQSLPFSMIDFARRPWVALSGWPIPYGDLAPFYRDANAFMKVDALNYDTDLFTRLHRPDPGFDPALLYYHFSKWAPEANFLKLYRRALARNVTVLYNAHLTRIDRDDVGKVSSVRISNFVGKCTEFPVRTLILATGGIETNRILLQNDHQERGGLGNHSGWLGKGFMEHPSIVVGEVLTERAFHLQRVFATHLRRGRKYSVRLSTSERWQRERQRLSASASLMFLERSTYLSSLSGTARRGPSRLFSKLLDLSQTAAVLATKGFVYRPGTRAELSIMVEQEPTTESRITLDASIDRFGLRRANLFWKITEPTWQTAVEFCGDLKSEIERLGFGEVRLLPGIDKDNPNWSDTLRDVNHHMGGTRMSAERENGVVRPDLQVWDIPNFYVCSCSVFPTASHSNPTLTLLALCSRLVGEIAGVSDCRLR